MLSLHRVYDVYIVKSFASSRISEVIYLPAFWNSELCNEIRNMVTQSSNVILEVATLMWILARMLGEQNLLHIKIQRTSISDKVLLTNNVKHSEIHPSVTFARFDEDRSKYV